MNIKAVLKALAVAGVVVGLTGCASSGGKKYTPGAKGQGVANAQQFYGQNISEDEEARLLSKRTLYFGYDRFDLKNDDLLVLSAHAKQLLENPKLRIRLDGHADERGSREYNVGLSERRAKAAHKFLVLKGVSPEQIAVVGYGKEKPAVLGHDENAWRLNRRAELHYEEIH